MNYFILFLEGIITFISPCLLPMLPLYVSYFAGSSSSAEKNSGTALKNSIGFVIGFTVAFVAMGAMASSLGGLLIRHRLWVDIISGLIIVLFGLSMLLGVSFIGAFFGRLKRRLMPKGVTFNVNSLGFFKSVLFGLIFSVGWTPCVSAFLGSALLMASQQGHILEGMLMLFIYSLGLGIPFVISAVLIDSLKSTFNVIMKHHNKINIVSGVFLIFIGIAMMTGYMSKLLALLSSAYIK